MIWYYRIYFSTFASESDGLETAITNYNHLEESRCISATFLFIWFSVKSDWLRISSIILYHNSTAEQLSGHFALIIATS